MIDPNEWQEIQEISRTYVPRLDLNRRYLSDDTVVRCIELSIEDDGAVIAVFAPLEEEGS